MIPMIQLLMFWMIMTLSPLVRPHLFIIPVALHVVNFVPVLETDRPNPTLTQAEIKYVPEQM